MQGCRCPLLSNSMQCVFRWRIPTPRVKSWSVHRQSYQTPPILVPTWLESILATVLSFSPCTIHRQGLHRRHQFCLPQDSKATTNLRRFIWPFDQVFLNFVAEFCFYHSKHSFVKIHKIPQVLHHKAARPDNILIDMLAHDDWIPSRSSSKRITFTYAISPTPSSTPTASSFPLFRQQSHTKKFHRMMKT